MGHRYHAHAECAESLPPASVVFGLLLQYVDRKYDKIKAARLKKNEQEAKEKAVKVKAEKGETGKTSAAAPVLNDVVSLRLLARHPRPSCLPCLTIITAGLT